ncbi:High-copy suppressor of rspA [Yokenella regensburgei]|uniref:High-copy suppressor of rspA n=1 Tax=Yokenella regensburgei TaxID=158877 RepID=A0AB38FUX5_9ENTR|nr:High-copy suppressor of rspA [Yokenella regensburgei]
MTYRSKVAVIFLLGFFLDLINMFIASVAWPAMSHSLQATVAGLAWVNNGYIIGLTLAIPLSAWLTRHLGAKRVFLLSLLVFSLGAVASGFAGSLATLVTWRIVQGAGGGLLIPVGQALAWQLYKPHERARLSAAVMLVGLLAPALSPAAGGFLVETLSWRWVFFASVPLSLITLLLAGCWLKPGKNASGPRPLLRLSLLRDPLLRFAMLIYLCVPGIFIGVSVVSMFWLQTIIGLSPAAAGALMLHFKMQACRTGSGATHSSDFLPRLNFLLFPDQHRIVMGVGAQVIIVVFDDNKITVTTQCVTGIDDASISGRGDCLSFTACDIDTFIPVLRELFDNFAVSRPAPR